MPILKNNKFLQEEHPPFLSNGVKELFEKLKSEHTDDEIALLRRAYEFAARAHEGQKRKSGAPFISHPLATVERLVEMHLDAPAIAAAFLHDVCEDTKYTIKDIQKEFGEEIAFIVEGVTKLNKIKYKGSERTAESLRKMFLAIGEDIRIVILKLVDRVHNMETLAFLPPEKQKRIALETIEIYASLAYRLGMTELSGDLEDLAFPYVYPEEHAWIEEHARERYKDADRYIKTLKPLLEEELKKENIEVIDIHARKKHTYSLYKKLLKYDMDIEKITDIVALRVIVPSIEACYGALGVIHKLWPPLPGKIKDYIALPKPNGYRSLHTTVFGIDGKPVEIQMRTPEMHAEAEAGIAAHWAYTEFKKREPDAEKKGKHSFAHKKQAAWIQQLREWQKEFESPSEFLESLKIDFFKSRIFVLTPKGDVFDLPEGSTPVDFAYHVHTQIGNTATGARVNGKMVALDHLLRNGDIVEILTQKNKKPNPDWLGVVKSTEARKKISSFIRKMEEERKFQKPGGELVEFRVTAHDRIGLLRDVTDAFAQSKINLKNVGMETKNRTFPVLIIHALLKNRAELEKLMIKIKRVKGVEEIGYKLL